MAATASSRDIRIDFWRGFALITIFVNHIPGNLVEHLSHRNFGLSDSAELFVFLAGFSAACAYFGRFVDGDPITAIGRVLERTWQLYLTHVTLILAAITLFFVAAMAFSDVHWAEAYGLDVLSTDPIRGIVGLATLGHQIGYFNILPLYVALFAFLPVIMLLARGSLGLALAVSAAIYLSSHLWGLRLPSYPTESGWFFEPLCWQFIFTIGFVCGVATRRGQPVAHSPMLYGAALVMIAVGFVIAVFKLFPTPEASALPGVLWLVDKSTLTLPRLLHALALFYVVANTPAFDRMVARLGDTNVLTVIGRNALPMFCFGSLLAVVGQILLRRSGGDLYDATALVLAGVLAHIAFARAIEWWRHRKAAATAARPTHAAVAAGRHLPPRGSATA